VTFALESGRQRQHSEHDLLPRRGLLVCLLPVLQHGGLSVTAGVRPVRRAQGSADSDLVQTVGEQHQAPQERQGRQHPLRTPRRLMSRIGSVLVGGRTAERLSAWQSLVDIDCKGSRFVGKMYTAGCNVSCVDILFSS